DHGCQIVGIPVHVISRPSLAGSTMSTTVVRHNSEAVLCEKEHLTVPHVGVQRPSVREGYDWTRAPVFVVDRRAIFHRDGAHVHVSCASSLQHRQRLIHASYPSAASTRCGMS